MPLSILLLDDSPSDAELVSRAIRKGIPGAGVHIVASGKQFREALATTSPDVVVADFTIPGIDGMASLELVQRTAPEIPYILISGALREEIVVAMLKQGAADFLLKDHLTRLPIVIERAIREQRDRLQQEETERHLLNSETRYRVFFEANPDPTFVFDRSSLRFLDVNPAALSRYGYSRDEFSAMTLADLWPPEEKHNIQEALAQWPLSQKHSIAGRHRVHNGDTIWVEMVSHAVHFDGQDALIAVITDLTEKRRAEEALRESEIRYRNVVETATDLIYTTNRDGYFTYANAATLEITGYSAEEVLNMHYFDLIVPSSRTEVRRFYMRQFLTQTPESYIEIPFFSKQGDVLWFGQKCSLLMDGQTVTGFHLIARDITQQVRAERELAQSLSLLRAALDSTVDGILVVNSAMKIETYNQKFLELWQIPESVAAMGDDAVLLDFVATMLRDPDSFRARVEDLYKKPEAISHDLIELADGRLFERFSQPQRLEKTIVGRVWSFRDVTEQRTSEQQLRASHHQLRALAARLQTVREEESARISREIHDELGQSLTGLKMDLKWLEKHIPDAAPYRERIDSMIELITGTITLVRRIATELRPGILDALGLLPAIEWHAQEFHSRTGIECALDCSQKELDIPADRATVLFRIVQEASTNVARHAGATAVRINMSSVDGGIVLAIRDNGRGITREELNDPHSLGLLGMRERVMPFGGQVEITGSPGKGTTVTVMLPAERGS